MAFQPIQINPIDLLQNELEVGEFLRQEKFIIKKLVSRSFKKNQELVESTNLPKTPAPSFRTLIHSVKRKNQKTNSGH